MKIQKVPNSAEIADHQFQRKFKTPSRLADRKGRVFAASGYSSALTEEGIIDVDSATTVRTPAMIKDNIPVIEPGSEERLPSRRTFLLRFSNATQPEAGVYRGRVEHIGTGRTARFTSLQEATDFAEEIMATEGFSAENPAH